MLIFIAIKSIWKFALENTGSLVPSFSLTPAWEGETISKKPLRNFCAVCCYIAWEGRQHGWSQLGENSQKKDIPTITHLLDLWQVVSGSLYFSTPSPFPGVHEAEDPWTRANCLGRWSFWTHTHHSGLPAKPLVKMLTLRPGSHLCLQGEMWLPVLLSYFSVVGQ